MLRWGTKPPSRSWPIPYGVSQSDAVTNVFNRAYIHWIKGQGGKEDYNGEVTTLPADYNGDDSAPDWVTGKWIQPDK
jgi:hypothetical protein